MTKAEFNRAFELANDRTVDLSDVDDTHLYGCALPEFQRVTTEIGPVAKMIRWHCLMMNGQWDHETLNEMRAIARYKFELVGVGSDALIESCRATGDILAITRQILNS
jgi:hypothetical protein